MYFVVENIITHQSNLFFCVYLILTVHKLRHSIIVCPWTPKWCRPCTMNRPVKTVLWLVCITKTSWATCTPRRKICTAYNTCSAHGAVSRWNMWSKRGKCEGLLCCCSHSMWRTHHGWRIWRRSDWSWICVMDDHWRWYCGSWCVIDL